MYWQTVLNTLEHGVTRTATITIVLAVAILHSPVAVGVIDLIIHTVTQMIKLDCGVQQQVSMHMHTTLHAFFNTYYIITCFLHACLKHATMELFDWLEENHLMREDWNIVTMEHGVDFAIKIFIMKRL